MLFMKKVNKYTHINLENFVSESTNKDFREFMFADMYYVYLFVI